MASRFASARASPSSSRSRVDNCSMTASASAPNANQACSRASVPPAASAPEAASPADVAVPDRCASSSGSARSIIGLFPGHELRNEQSCKEREAQSRHRFFVHVALDFLAQGVRLFPASYKLLHRVVLQVKACSLGRLAEVALCFQHVVVGGKDRFPARIHFFLPV